MPVNFDKTRRFALNLPVEVADKVALLAEADRRSVASWLRNCVVDAVEKASIDSVRPSGRTPDAKPVAAPDGWTEEVVTKKTEPRRSDSFTETVMELLMEKMKAEAAAAAAKD